MSAWQLPGLLHKVAQVVRRGLQGIPQRFDHGSLVGDRGRQIGLVDGRPAWRVIEGGKGRRRHA